jgi:hypothetical protein
LWLLLVFLSWKCVYLPHWWSQVYDYAKCQCKIEKKKQTQNKSKLRTSVINCMSCVACVSFCVAVCVRI